MKVKYKILQKKRDGGWVLQKFWDAVSSCRGAAHQENPHLELCDHRAPTRSIARGDAVTCVRVLRRQQSAVTLMLHVNQITIEAAAARTAIGSRHCTWYISRVYSEVLALVCLC